MTGTISPESPALRDIVVGTAGHIDHGKSSLVRALTGTDPDRLKEEKARGITVDLGFAHLERDGVRYGFVDVPGHERFVRNMLAGAAGFDAVLLVVAADESVMPQTREHVEICRLLGVRTAVVALTRVDLVDDPDIRELAALETRELLQGTPMEEAPLVPVSSVTGEGLPELIGELARAASAVPPRGADGPFRLPVDRAFSMRGFGAVVTGALSSGRVAVGDEVEVLPAGERVRVRGLQVHGRAAESAAAGRRTALNLSGGGRLGIGRGSVVAAPGAFAPARMLDASLEVVSWANGPLVDEERVHLHLGTAVALARVRLLGGADALAPGDSAFAQLRLETPLVGARGDRFIVRRYSPVITIGGGMVLDAHPPKRSPRSAAALARVAALADADEAGAALAFLEESGPAGLSPESLARRLGLGSDETARVGEALVGEGKALRAPGGLLLAGSSVQRLEARMLRRISAWESRNRLRPGMPVEQLRREIGAPVVVSDAVLARLAGENAVELDRDTVNSAGRAVELTPREQEVSDGVARILAESGYRPPTVTELSRELGAPVELVDALRRLLARERRVVLVTPELAFDAERLVELRRMVLVQATVRPEMDVAWFKEHLNLSRKHAIPLLEWLDRERVTIRVGNVRRVRASVRA